MAQRVVALQAAPGADQQPEPLIETITDLARRHRRHPRGRQLDGQRNPVEARQISTTAAASSAVATEKRGATLRARSTNRVTAAESMPAPQSSEGTSHNCSSATPNPSRLVAKTLTVAECARIASTRSAAASTHVLAVVEHQQPDPALQRGGHALGHALARLLGDAQHRGHRVGHRRRIGDRGQFEQPDAVRELVGQVRRDFGRQAGLADPAHPGQRHQPMSLQRLLHLGQLGLPPTKLVV